MTSLLKGVLDADPVTAAIIVAGMLILAFGATKYGRATVADILRGIRHCYRWCFGCRRGKHHTREETRLSVLQSDGDRITFHIEVHRVCNTCNRRIE